MRVISLDKVDEEESKEECSKKNAYDNYTPLLEEYLHNQTNNRRDSFN